MSDAVVMEPGNGTPLQAETPLPKVCGAKTRNGGTCRSTKVMTNGRCRMHGGATPHGMALPQWKHGRYSKYGNLLPKHLEGFHEALADPELLSLKEETALLSAEIMAALKAVDAEPPPPWAKALFLYKEAVRAKDKGEALEALGKVLEEGTAAAVNRERQMAKVRELVQEKTKTASAEWKRLNDLSAVVTVDNALAFARACLEAVKEEVGDRTVLSRVQDRVLKLLPKESPKTVEAE